MRKETKRKLFIMFGLAMMAWGIYGACVFAHSIWMGVLPIIFNLAGFIMFLVGIADVEDEGENDDE